MKRVVSGCLAGLLAVLAAEVSAEQGRPHCEIRADGFYADGVKTVLRGVCCRPEAVSERALILLRAMGANAIRTSHAPCGPRLYELCGRHGLLVWVDLPETSDGVREAVGLGRECGSVAMWGLPAGTDAARLRELNALVRSLDPTRPTVRAISKWDALEPNAVGDAAGLDDRPGLPESVLTDVERCLVYNRRSTIAVSAFGADGIERNVRQYRFLRDDARIWGFYVRRLFDETDGAAGGQGLTALPGVGESGAGLLTCDGRPRDSYWFYKANWNAEPMLHLCPSRTAETTNGVFDVLGFCNAGEVTLSLNGVVCGTREPDSVNAVRWEGVPLAPGLNRIALAAKDGALVSETRLFRKVPEGVSDPVPAARARRTVAVPEKAKWFADARFGLFVHWGIYSIPAKGEWYYARGDWKPGEYESLMKRFNPVKYDPREWARRAKAAGMRYAVLTSRHHDGFCMFDSRFTDYRITNTPYGKDAVREFVEAFRAEGLKVGFYHSLPDWTHRGYEDPETPEFMRFKRLHVPTEAERKAFRDLVYNHVHQLMTEYGRIDLLFFDYTSKYKTDLDTFDRERLLRMVRECQPDILVNDRLTYFKEDAPHFDYFTPEIAVPSGPIRVNGREVLWETCATMNDNWGYSREDENWKTPEAMVAGLVGCVSRDGNLLLNIGPTELGEIPEGAVRILDALAEWNAKNGESVRGCGSSRHVPPFGCAYTQRGDVLYLHYLQPSLGDTILPGLKGRMSRMTMLRTGETVEPTNLWGFELLEHDDQRIRTRGLRAGDVIRIELKSPTDGAAAAAR